MNKQEHLYIIGIILHELNNKKPKRLSVNTSGNEVYFTDITNGNTLTMNIKTQNHENHKRHSNSLET